jgi:hypothetical protein
LVRDENKENTSNNIYIYILDNERKPLFIYSSYAFENVNNKNIFEIESINNSYTIPRNKSTTKISYSQEFYPIPTHSR